MSEVPQPGNGVELQKIEEATHVALGEWIKGHLDDRMTMLEYNPQYYPYQRFDVASFGPLSPSSEPIEAGRLVMGEAFDELVDAMRSYAPVIKDRLAHGESSMIVTPHLQNVLDTPVVEAALSAAYDDERLVDDSIIMTGKVITRLAIFGVPAMEMMARMGRVYMSIPRSPSAREAGVANETIDHINWQMLRECLREVRHGKVIHQAPSNGRAKPQTRPYGSTVLAIPRADDITTRLITRYKSYAIPVAIRFGDESMDSGWVIGEPGYLREPEDIHRMMDNLANRASGLFENEEIVYEQPKENSVL